ncbi:MAG: beta-N-acetylhexosaminidase [Halobacteriovorax sp.]|nr:beta-N-acetylhexosaminidase [Halobacteriovorax sp.]|tara:strand:- start:166002 stop:167078 length:1077 start_codon:yes stop_codon:yes gene_type:complete
MKDLGQLIFTGISGITLTEEEKEFIEKENIGGIVLFAENFESPAQLAELVNSIQKLRDEYPLYISVDHEGGRVIRFRKYFTQFPPMMEIASVGSPKLCFEVSTIMAQELKACGINLNLAPVCDILTNESNKVIGDRAFGRDHESVSKYVSSAIRGFQTEGIQACAKHFPGHGSTTKDSHFDLPYVTKSLEELKQEEIQPFIKAIKSRVEFVMMAHLVVDAFDKEKPCTLSPAAHDYLRNELKFNRIIISDDMEMKAITDNYSIEDAAVMAINAGTDVIEYRTMATARVALEGLKEALKTKKLKNDVAKDRIARVLNSKKTHLADYSPVYIPELEKKINSRQSQLFIDELNKQLTEVSP